jgi:hypothetical protein
MFAAEPAGISLDDIGATFAVSRRTAERMRDAVGKLFPQIPDTPVGNDVEKSRVLGASVVHHPERKIGADSVDLFGVGKGGSGPLTRTPEQLRSESIRGYSR